MNRLRIHRKEPVYLGIILIVAGIILKRLVELTLIPDQKIELPSYVAIIYIAQALAIAAGIFLLIRQPSIRLPGKTELILLFVSIILTFLTLEIGARLWLSYLATPDQYDRYVLFTSIERQKRQNNADKEQGELGFARGLDGWLSYQKKYPSGNYQSLNNIDYGNIAGQFNLLVGYKR